MPESSSDSALPPMTPPPPPPPPPPILVQPGLPEVDVALDEHGLLVEDIDCRKCAYNLRGLSPEGRCPECGTSVGWSIHGDFLRYSDPVWVKRLADGAL